MKKKKIYQINDRTMKYLTLVQVKRQHKYLGLPGEFKSRYPQEIVFPNMEAGRVDEYYSILLKVFTFFIMCVNYFLCDYWTNALGKFIIIY